MLASFPGRSHRQYFIASSTAGEGLGDLVVMCGAIRLTDGRHTEGGGGGGGGGGGCPMKNIDVLSSTVRPKAGCQSVRKADDLYSKADDLYRSFFTTLGTDQHETGI